MSDPAGDDLVKNEITGEDPMAETEQEPQQPKDNKHIFRDVCSYILVTEFCERLAFYGLVGSLSIFLTRELGISSVMASCLGNTFSSVNYLSPLLGAYLAETHWGRYRTILYFCALYCVGMVLCTVSAHPDVSSPVLFFLGLFLFVAVGSGGIKPNVVVLGADQFDPTVPIEKVQMDSYFNYFYWSINIGATFSFGFLAYLAVNGIGAIPKSHGFFASFVIPAVAMAAAILVFTMGSSKYIKKPASGSALSTFVGVIIDASRGSRTGQIVVAGALAQVPGMVLVIISFFTPWGTKFLALLGMGFILVGIVALVQCGQSVTWVNGARLGNGGKYTDDDVDDAADVVLLSPYFGFIVMFSCVYSQMSSTFILQGCQMDLRIGSAMLSSAQLNLFDCTVILLLIPVFDSLLYPALANAGYSVTPLRKIGVGYIFALLSMVVAAIIEMKRKDSALLEVQSNCSDVMMSDMSVWWQTFQYILVGIAEILINISAIDLFYSQAPESMRSVCQALNLLTQTAGGMVSAGLLSIMNKWFTDDLNKGHLEYIFFAFGLLVIFNLIWFYYVSQGFVYKADRKHDRGGSILTTEDGATAEGDVEENPVKENDGEFQQDSLHAVEDDDEAHASLMG